MKMKKIIIISAMVFTSVFLTENSIKAEECLDAGFVEMAARENICDIAGEDLAVQGTEDLQEMSVNQMMNEQLEEESVKMLSMEPTAVSDNDNLNVQAEGLGLTISYPSDIKCGQPVTFTMNGVGGSGNYKYRIHDLLVYDGSEWVSVYDVSYGSNGAFKESNEFTFTFYASGTYYIRFGVFDASSYGSYSTGLFEYPITIQDEKYPSVEQIVETVATQCQAECITDFEKAVWLHDWIIDHGDYDYSYSYSSAEGVLARGHGTCESYHRAYVMLLNKVGIETGRIVGNGHVWTAVKMDGEWYQIDTTWDDMGADYKGTYYEHMYFGLTDYIIGLVHSDHKAAVSGYESVALENNYFIKTGKIRQWSDPFVDIIKKNITDGQTDFSLSDKVDSSMPDNYKNVIYNLVAYQLSHQDWGKDKVLVSYADNQLTCKVVLEEANDDYTGMRICDNEWRYVNNGQVDYTYTGVGQNPVGYWYFINGTLDFGYSGMIIYGNEWRYVNKGMVDFTYTGVGQNPVGYWYFINGTLDFGYSGMIIYDNAWRYVNNGMVDFAYTGVGQNPVGYWYFINGTLDFGYSGMIIYNNAWRYVKGGKVDFVYAGIADNPVGKWYFKDGEVQFSYSGTINVNGTTYSIVNGKVV